MAVIDHARIVDSSTSGHLIQKDIVTVETTKVESQLSLKRTTDIQHSAEAVVRNLSRSYSNPSLHVSPSHSLALIDTPIPVPSPTQVLIHVQATGICGSDLHLWHTGRIGPLTVTQDCILGHEASGTVLAVGFKVSSLKQGDRIAIEPGVPCETCSLCFEGKYNLCEDVAFAGICPHPGTIRRFMCHEAKYCHKMPEDMTFAQGALLEPLSVILHAVEQCKGAVSMGRPALICGAGPIGLIAAAVCKASGAYPIVITDVDEARLNFAHKFLSDLQTYQVLPNQDPETNSQEIRALFGCGPRIHHPSGVRSPDDHLAPRIVLECTGMQSSIITGILSCRRAGTVMVIGVGNPTMNSLPFMHLSLAEIDLRFINRYRDTWPAGINALGKGKVLDLDGLVSHRFRLEEAVKAMELCADRGRLSVKVLVVDEGEIDIDDGAMEGDDGLG